MCRYSLRRVGRFYQMQNQCGFDALKLRNYAGDLGREVTYCPFSRLSRQFFTAARQNLRSDIRRPGGQRMAGAVQPS